MNWRKSSKCANSECVEVGRDRSEADGQILVRNSKVPDKVLGFDRDEWTAFLAGIKAGDFDEL